METACVSCAHNPRQEFPPQCLLGFNNNLQTLTRESLICCSCGFALYGMRSGVDGRCTRVPFPLEITLDSRLHAANNAECQHEMSWRIIAVPAIGATGFWSALADQPSCLPRQICDLFWRWKILRFPVAASGWLF